MSRIYYIENRENQKRQKIVQDAIGELHKARRAIDPALLEAARLQIERLSGAAIAETARGGREPVNKQGILFTIALFLETKKDDPEFRKKIKAMLDS